MVRKVITGNSAAAYGAKLAKAEVISAYPITPQTTVVEKIAEFVANGELKTQFVTVESEHSALAVCIAASNTGARTFTATSSQGLTLMHELLHWASSARIPVVIVNINRSMAPPWNIWADHTDSVSQRDTGCIQFYCESNQEVLDTVIQAYRIVESPDILLPTIISQDAFYLSHTVLPVDIPDQKLIDKFLPKFNPPYKLDVEKPYAHGSLSMPHEWSMELKYNVAEAMEVSRERIKTVDEEFGKMFGRKYGGLLDCYRTDDAEIILIAAGTTASSVKEVVDKLRVKGKKVGLARLRVFRPFPIKELRDVAKNVEVIGVLDRCFTFGYEGPLFTEVKGALYNLKNRPIIKNYVIGVCGRDVTINDIEMLYANCYEIKEKGLDKEVEWIGVKR